MAEHTTGDLILYNNHSYAIVEHRTEDGLYEIRMGRQFIQNVCPEQIVRIKVNPPILKSAGFEQHPEIGDLWIYAGNAVRMVNKVDNPSEFEIIVAFQNQNEVGGTLYFIEYFDQLQELYKKAFHTVLPTNFSYNIS